MKKYEFTGETKNIDGHILHQIRALMDFGNVKIGDLGGWIESEENLSQEGNCWVYGNAQAYGNAWVGENATVYGNAHVCKNAWVYGNAQVCGNAQIYGNAQVCGNAQIYGNAKMCGDAQAYGDFWVYRNVPPSYPIGGD